MSWLSENWVPVTQWFVLAVQLVSTAVNWLSTRRYKKMIAKHKAAIHRQTSLDDIVFALRQVTMAQERTTHFLRQTFGDSQ